MTPPAGRRQRASRPSQSKSTKEPTPETPAADPPGSSSSSASPLGLEGKPFVRPRSAPDAATASELDRPAYEPPKPPPLEWTPERLQPVLRGIGHVVHSLDPVGETPQGKDLWKLTEEDAREIAEPLSRIANRYATLRGAAGFSDEISVVATVAPYVKSNLAARGRVKAAIELEQRESPHASRYQPEAPRQPETGVSEPSGQPESQPGSQQGSLPESLPEVQAGSGQDARAGGSEPEMAPKAGVADAFEYALPVSDTSLPPHLEPPAVE